jgi:hypothetical protein
MHAQLFESRLVTLILGALAVAVGGWVVWAYAAGPSVDGVVERELSPEAWTSLVETAFEGRDAEAGAVRVVPVWMADGRVAVGAQPESVLRAVASQ